MIIEIVILTKCMLDSALEPSYNLSKNLLLLPWILKAIVDMVNDSTPLNWGENQQSNNFTRDDNLRHFKQDLLNITKHLM